MFQGLLFYIPEGLKCIYAVFQICFRMFFVKNKTQVESVQLGKTLDLNLYVLVSPRGIGLGVIGLGENEFCT